MFQRSECKKKAKKALRRHYVLFVFLCLIAAMSGVAHSSSYTAFTEEVKLLTSKGNAGRENVNSRWNIHETITNTLEDQKNSKKLVKDLVKDKKDQKPIYIGKHIQIGHNNGVFAKVRNEMVSGAFIISAVSALTKVIGSSTAAVAVCIVLAFAVTFSVWVFLINTYRIIYARVFLEGRIYKKVPLQRFAFLIYVRKWKKASLTMLLESFYYNLWCLTIVGGIIKFYSYFAVPYIVAENPDIDAKKAIRLSRNMMNGHKWECFKLYLSFVGWDILDILTFGISGILFSNPYQEATLCEYYVYIRESAKEKELDGVAYLNDRYLYEIPSQEVLTQIYGSVEDYESDERTTPKNLLEFFSDFFGVYLLPKNYEEEKQIIRNNTRYQRIKHILNQEEYAQRLLPIPEKKRRKILEDLYFSRKYSIWTLMLFFVFFSFCGWVWEVSLHLLRNGEFVNRGVLHGPYLPIYGTGALIILLCLNKLRNNPLAEFLGGILLCGAVEYSGGYMMEMLHHGEKWWNYSGYFLNIDGRVCAEGLLVFGIGGMIIVYLLAPLFDNNVRRLPYKIMVLSSVVLLAIMGSDMIYSSFHPNTGKGITNTAKYEWNKSQQVVQMVKKSERI